MNSRHLPSARTKEEQALKQLAKVLDAYWTIPGTNIRLGLDAVLGLIPGVGDFSGLVISCYIIFASAKLGVSGPTLFRMVANVAVDVAIGAIPILGDVADVLWRSNMRNIELLERAAIKPGGRPTARIFLMVGLLLLLLFLFTLTLAGLMLWGLFKAL